MTTVNDDGWRFSVYGFLILLMALLVPVSPVGAADSLPRRQGQPETTQMATPDSLAIPTAASASESGEESGKPAGQYYREMADDFHQMVTEKLLTSANWLDSFFRDEQAEIEENKTNLRLRLSSFLENANGLSGNARLRLRLVLPELEDRFHIMITGERDEDKDLSQAPLMSKKGEIDEDTDRNMTMSLRYFAAKARDMNISFKVGARLNQLPPVFYAGPRFRISRNFDPWVIRFTQEIKDYSDDGWETDTGFDFEKPLADRLFFRIRTEGSWYENEVGYYYSVNFIVFQVIDEDRALEYAWHNYLETRPGNHLDQLLLQVTYRQRFWRPWLFFEIEPQLAFRHDDEFVPTPGIIFAVEALFGK